MVAAYTTARRLISLAAPLKKKDSSVRQKRTFLQEPSWLQITFVEEKLPAHTG